MNTKIGIATITTALLCAFISVNARSQSNIGYFIVDAKRVHNDPTTGLFICREGFIWNEKTKCSVVDTNRLLAKTEVDKDFPDGITAAEYVAKRSEPTSTVIGVQLFREVALADLQIAIIYTTSGK